VSLIREFYGVTVAERAARGVFVTTGTYTPDAVAFARGKPLDLVDGPALAAAVAGIPTVSPVDSVPRSAPACPKCGGGTVKRVAKRGPNAGGEFWGCGRYPECRGIVGADPS
jgi:restriction system protein